MAGGRIPEDDLRVALIGATPLKSDSRSDNEIQVAKSLARLVRSGPIFFNGISRDCPPKRKPDFRYNWENSVLPP